MVLATQNPVSAIGTYPLPEAQLDRFMMKLHLGYPTRSEEVEILRRNTAGQPILDLKPVATGEEILAAMERRKQVLCADRVSDYIVSLAEQTRHDERIALGVSTRGCLALMEACRARAMLEGREYVTPDDVQFLAVPVLAHRLVLNRQKNVRLETEGEVLTSILRSTPIRDLT